MKRKARYDVILHTAMYTTMHPAQYPMSYLSYPLFLKTIEALKVGGFVSLVAHSTNVDLALLQVSLRSRYSLRTSPMYPNFM
jgi:hypothetical protein